MAENATERSVSFASIARLVIVWHTHSYTRTVLTRRRQSKANSTNSHANDNNNNNKTNNSSNNNKPGNQNGNVECWLGRLYQNWSGAAAAAAGYDSILNRVSHGHKADTDTQVCTQITKTTLATAATTKTTTAVDAGNGLHKGGVWASSACALLQLTFWLQRVNDIPFFVVACFAAAGGPVSLIVIMWVTGQRAVVSNDDYLYLYLSSLLNSCMDCFINVALTKRAGGGYLLQALLSSWALLSLYTVCVYTCATVCVCVCVDPT